MIRLPSIETLPSEPRQSIVTGMGNGSAADCHNGGIIPLDRPDCSRDSLIYAVAMIISEAVNGEGIHACELAEMIVEAVEEHHFA